MAEEVKFSIVINEVKASEDELEDLAGQFAEAFHLEKERGKQILNLAPITFLDDLERGEVSDIKETLLDLSEDGLSFRITPANLEDIPEVIWADKPTFKNLDDGELISGIHLDLKGNGLVCPNCEELFQVRSVEQSVPVAETVFEQISEEESPVTDTGEPEAEQTKEEPEVKEIEEAEEEPEPEEEPQPEEVIEDVEEPEEPEEEIEELDVEEEEAEPAGVAAAEEPEEEAEDVTDLDEIEEVEPEGVEEIDEPEEIGETTELDEIEEEVEPIEEDEEDVDVEPEPVESDETDEELQEIEEELGDLDDLESLEEDEEDEFESEIDEIEEIEEDVGDLEDIEDDIGEIEEIEEEEESVSAGVSGPSDNGQELDTGDTGSGSECNVFIASINGDEQRRSAIQLLSEIRGCSEEEAEELTQRPIIPVAKGVSEERAEEIENQFDSVGLNVNITRRN